MMAQKKIHNHDLETFHFLPFHSFFLINGKSLQYVFRRKLKAQHFNYDKHCFLYSAVQALPISYMKPYNSVSPSFSVVNLRE